MNEEIKAEALTKNIEGFTRFLFSLCVDSGKFLDLSKISRSSAVPRQTVQRYFELLEDTLIINRNLAFAKSDKRKLIQHPKFFIFDTGVLNALLNNFTLSEDRIGFLFENLFFNQLRVTLSYSELDYRISSYRTDAGAEVDFVLEIGEEVIAIEVKSGVFSLENLSGFHSFESFVGKKVKKVVVTPSGPKRKMADVTIIDWQSFLENLPTAAGLKLNL